MEEFYVYLWTNLINKKQYVGITNDVPARMWSHVCGKEGSLISKAIKKYGAINFDFKILHTCKTRDAANILEKEEILVHNCRFPYGYNLSEGGDSFDSVLVILRSTNPKKYKELNDKRKEGQRRAHATKTPEERKIIARKGKEFYVGEQRRKANKKGSEKYTIERRKLAAKKAALKLTSERRKEIAKKAEASRVPGSRSIQMLKIHAASTPEKRLERTKKGRSAAAAKKMLDRHVQHRPWPSDKLKYRTLLESHIDGNIWLAYDPNSGHHATRLHPRSIAGYTIVNPHGAG